MFKTGAKVTGEKERDYWQTPPHLLAIVNEFYGGSWLDPCPANPTFDGLSCDWGERAYINCPFSELLLWAKHGLTQAGEQIWICHHAHDRKWFRLLVSNSNAMIMLKDRIRFIDPKSDLAKATMPGACQSLLYRGHRPRAFLQAFDDVAIISLMLKQPATEATS